MVQFPDGTVQSTAADGHSLDAVDGDPVDAVFVNAAGNVGFNTTNPEVELDIASLDSVGTITVQPNSAGNITELGRLPMLPKVIDKANTASDVWADTAYR